MSPAKEGYTSKEIVKLTKVTLRQLQWWDERGYLKPQMIAHARLYRPDQLEDIKRYAKVRKCGISGHKSTVLMKRKFDLEALAAAIKIVRAAGLKIR